MSIIAIVVSILLGGSGFLTGRYVFPSAGDDGKVAENLSDSEPIRTACAPKFIREFGAMLCVHMRCGQSSQAVKGDRPDASECARALENLNVHAVRKDCEAIKLEDRRKSCYKTYWPNRH